MPPAPICVVMSETPILVPGTGAKGLKGIVFASRGREANLSGARLRKADLTGAYVTVANLRGADLSAANLTEAYLREAYLSEANLCGADLSAADLSAANFSWADLRQANLSGAYLHWAIFNAAIFSGAELLGAKLGGTILTDIDFSETNGLEFAKHGSASPIGIDTIYKCKGRIPEIFLRGAGVPEPFIVQVKALIMAMEPIQFYSCFISYGHADKSFARRLHGTLQARGIRCWLDEHQLLPGDDIYEGVDRGIRMWDKFLLCCSEHSLQPASWVDKEIITALEKEEAWTRARGARVHSLIPLNLDGYIFSDEWKSGYRAELRRRLAADFTGWERDNQIFEIQVDRLVRALRADANAREDPPTSKL